jgi:flagellar biosynthesis protein FliR
MRRLIFCQEMTGYQVGHLVQYMFLFISRAGRFISSSSNFSPGALFTDHHPRPGAHHSCLVSMCVICDDLFVLSCGENATFCFLN